MLPTVCTESAWTLIILYPLVEQKQVVFTLLWLPVFLGMIMIPRLCLTTIDVMHCCLSFAAALQLEWFALSPPDEHCPNPPFAVCIQM